MTSETKAGRAFERTHYDGSRWYVLALLTAVYISNIADRFVIATLIEPIKADLKISDTSIGFLTGTALAIFYTGMGIPLGLIADRVDRRKLIAVSIAAWSLMTCACGYAANFSQLMLARIGVGIGEAGGTPASQSIIADLFPFSERVFATSIFALGAAAGSMLGGSAGGAISDYYGWRSAFIALAIPGAFVALLVRFTVSEPQRGQLDSFQPAKAPSLRETLRFIRAQHSLLHIFAGGSIVTFWGWGLLWWTPAFLTRSYHLTTGAAGGLMGLINGIGGAIGILIGGYAIQKLGRNDPRWQSWVIGLATLFGSLMSLIAYSTTSKQLTTIMLSLYVPIAYLNIAPILSLTQSLVRPQMRALSCALLLFGANVANLALAPQFIGIMSDLFRTHSAAGVQSLRYALIATSLTGLWAAYHFWAAGKCMRRDLERAGAV